MEPQKSIWSFSFAALIFIAVIINMGVSVIVPAMPIIMKTHGFTDFFLTSAFLALLVGRFITSNVVGFLLVKRSPITLLIAAFTLQALTMAAFVAVESEVWFVVLRFLEGVFEGIVSVTLQVMVISLSTPVDRGRKMGVFQSSYGIGFILGPALGGFALQLVGPQGVFIVTAALMMIGLVWLLSATRALKRDMVVPPQSEPKFTLEFVKFLPFYSGAIIQRGMYVALSMLLPLFLIDKFMLPPYQVGLYFTGSAVLTSILMPIGGKVADSPLRSRTIVLSILAMGCSIVGFGFASSQPAFTVLYVVETIAFSFMVPSAMKVFGDAVQQHPQRAQIVGTASSSRELLNIAMVFGLIPLYKAGPALPWILLGVLTVSLSIPYLRLTSQTSPSAATL